MAIVERAKALILQPAQAWQVIAAEPADTKSLFTGYAMPLAAIPAVVGFIGTAIFAEAVSGMAGVQVGIATLLMHAILGYVLGIAGVWVWGKIIQALAPRFGGVADETAAMKLAVYSPTAAWVAGIFAIVPPLAMFTILGLWSLYIFYKGVPVVTRVSQDKAMVFTLSVILCGILVNLVVGLIAVSFIRV
jgi:hypothetical protein